MYKLKQLVHNIRWNIKMNYIGKCLQKYYSSCSIKNGVYKGKARDKKIVVSLTSFPKRFSTLNITIKCIMKQSVKPDEIILYLDEDVDISILPKKLLILQKYGLQIVKRPENLKPHKKYYYAMKEHSEDIIITVDDDMIYERNMIKQLLKSYKKYPNAISAKRVHQIKKDENGNILPYSDWKFEYSTKTKPRMDLFVTGIGGVLYPPNCLPEETFNIDRILNLCANNDDIWLKFMQMLKGTEVVYVRGIWDHPCCMMETQEIALSQKNVEQNWNDKYIKNLEEYYRITLV